MTPEARSPDRTDPGAADLAELLREAEEHHGPYEAISKEHHWWDYYAAYVVERRAGRSPDESAAAAASYTDGLS
ncbi:MAG TPA: hypothetical protein VHK88_15865 [Aquihabitans sp.]|jgi:hypothetical protein|nr:hypothetical protein [Aquihabitans sp.]